MLPVVAAKAVSSLPVFVTPLSNLMARAGHKFKLECHVKGDPQPTVAWFHNHKPVKETLDCRVSFASIFRVQNIVLEHRNSF